MAQGAVARRVGLLERLGAGETHAAAAFDADLADACAFLCSAQAGYISGQNLQIDGGSYEGLI